MDAREKLLGMQLHSELETHDTPASTNDDTPSNQLKETVAEKQATQEDIKQHLAGNAQVTDREKIAEKTTDVLAETNIMQTTQDAFSHFSPPPETIPTSQIPIPQRRRYKKQTLKETHLQRTYYIEKEIVQIIDYIVGEDLGGKYRLVNDALRAFILQEYPEYAHMLRKEPN